MTPTHYGRWTGKTSDAPMAAVNRQITLASRPLGLPKISDFQLGYTALPSPAAGEALVRTLYLPLDPSMRGRMDDTESYARPVAIGEVMPGGAVAVVVQSEDPSFRTGQVVEGMLRWREYAVAQGIEAAPQAFIGMLQGNNQGKQLVQLSVL